MGSLCIKFQVLKYLRAVPQRSVADLPNLYHAGSIAMHFYVTLDLVLLLVFIVVTRRLPMHGEWRKTMEPQELGNSSGLGQVVVETRESPKSP